MLFWSFSTGWVEMLQKLPCNSFSHSEQLQKPFACMEAASARARAFVMYFLSQVCTIVAGGSHVLC